MKTPKAATAPVATLQHYWLVAGQVHYDFSESAVFHRNLNCIIRTDRQSFAHANMGKAQQLLQMRLLNEKFPPEGPGEGFKITDVFLMSISYLGQMTVEEFQEGFAEMSAEQSKAEALLEKLRKDNASTN